MRLKTLKLGLLLVRRGVISGTAQRARYTAAKNQSDGVNSPFRYIRKSNEFISIKFRRTQPRAICNWSSRRHKLVQFPSSVLLFPQTVKL